MPPPASPSPSPHRRNYSSSPAMRRPKPCRYWAKGTCSKGKTCNFAHDRNRLDPSPRRASANEDKPTAGEQIKLRWRNRSTEDRLNTMLAGAAAKSGKKLHWDNEKLD